MRSLLHGENKGMPVTLVVQARIYVIISISQHIHPLVLAENSWKREMFHQLSKIRLRLWDKFWYVSLCHCTFMQYRSNSFANLNCLRMYNHVVFLSHTSASRTRVSVNGIADQVEFTSAVITKKKNFSEFQQTRNVSFFFLSLFKICKHLKTFTCTTAPGVARVEKWGSSLNCQRNGDLQNPNAKKYVVFNWKNKGHNKGFSLDIARYRLYIDQYPTDTDGKNTEKYKIIFENYSMNIGTGELVVTRPDSVPWNICYLLIAVRNY